MALVGGIIIVISGILAIIGSPFLGEYSILGTAGALLSGIVQLIIGIICVVGSKLVRTLAWAIILLILGIIAGGIGGVLVVIGALLGLIDHFT